MSEFRAALQRLVSVNEYEIEDEEDAREIDEAQQRLCLEIESAKALLARPEPDTDNSELASQVRESVEWLANNAKGMSLLNWDAHSNVILRAAHALDAVEIARPEPKPRITREEAEKLLESWHEQRLYDRHFKESLNTSDELKEACLAAMGVSESPPAVSDVE